jgi:Domain of unknown function (DUF4136)
MEAPRRWQLLIASNRRKKYGHLVGMVSPTIFVLALLATQTALAQKINIQFDQAADFAKYKTFNLREGRLNSRNPMLNSELVKKQIDSDIERDLTARGLTQVSGPADLNVFYHFGSARRTQLEAYPAGWRGLGTRMVRVPYAEGTLVIDLHDAGTRSLVWRAIASEQKSDPAKIQGKLDDMVKKSFRKYPPKK